LPAPSSRPSSSYSRPSSRTCSSVFIFIAGLGAYTSSSIIDFMGLSAMTNEFAGNLPHGYQRALGVSIALACNPTLLMLDEPVTGMNPTETGEMVERIKKIRERGITILLVEHDMKVVMGISDGITVISYGKKIAEGTQDEIRHDEQVIEAYLGKDEDATAAA
jgi:branched-chain amino acid transport system ATP-binding protein